MSNTTTLSVWLLTVAAFFAAFGVSGAQSPDFSQLTLNFRDVTATSVNQSVDEFGDNEKEVEFGDYDNDGDIDVLIAVAYSDFGQRRNKLYRNDDGVLNEVSGTPVIPGFELTDTSRSAFLRDYDQDGFLDIIIVNDSNSGTGTNNSPGKTKYYRNVNGTTFVNESERLDNQTGSACNGTSEDFDGNGVCDLLMCNYANSSQDSLGYNGINGSDAGQFSNVTVSHMPPDGAGSYGVHSEAADMNGDSKIDLLISNRTNQPAFIRYNDNGVGSSGIGDFRYAGSSVIVADESTGIADNALVPADFNNDGRMDIYNANAGVAGRPIADAIYLNTGNNEFNQATFEVVPLLAELDNETAKVTSNDLDGDGRVDAIVMSEDRRPFILRNTSENEEVSFIDWTPAAFSELHRGWQSNSDQLLGDESPDIMVGATNDDFLFENIASLQFDADMLESGILPDVHNADSIQIVGQLPVNGTTEFTSSAIPVGARVSLLLRSLGDVTLEVSDENQTLTSNRQGHGTDEAIQFVHSGGDLSISVTVEAISFDGDGDGLVTLLDVAPFVDCLVGVSADCDPFDTNDDGLVTLLDVSEFVSRLIAGTSSEAFYLEVLSRSQ